MYDEIIELVTYKTTDRKDEFGDAVKDMKKRPVFAEMKSVGMKEFYQAQTNGFKPEIAFNIPDYLEYQNEKELIYSGNLYRILRTYRKGNQLEIICYGGVRNVSAEKCN